MQDKAMKRILVASLQVSLIATMLCQVVDADGANMHIKVKAPELSGKVLIESGNGPAAGAEVQLCEKGWKNCTDRISTDANGKFKFGAIKPKHTNYVLISWPGANSVTAEVRIEKKAKPLVIEMHLH
jgi:hypothetical protein